MKEATIINEMKLLHERIDELGIAQQSLIDSTYDNRMRLRAFETIINRSYILHFIFNPKRIALLMARLDRDEIKASTEEQQQLRKEAAAQQLAARKAAEVVAQKKQDEADLARKEKKHKRTLRKHGIKVDAKQELPEEVNEAIKSLRAEDAEVENEG
jgi:hypothetical protein